MQWHDYKGYTFSFSNETFVGGKREEVNRDTTYLNLPGHFFMWLQLICIQFSFLVAFPVFDYLVVFQTVAVFARS